MNKKKNYQCKIPISIGELFDKYSILEIKISKIKNQKKINLVKKELTLLKPYIDRYPLQAELYNKLKNVNTKLWEIEDMLRIKEQAIEFDEKFIELARSVYFTNDERADIKKKINMIFKSEIVEVKDYVEYKTKIDCNNN